MGSEKKKWRAGPSVRDVVPPDFHEIPNSFNWHTKLPNKHTNKRTFVIKVGPKTATLYLTGVQKVSKPYYPYFTKRLTEAGYRLSPHRAVKQPKHKNQRCKSHSLFGTVNKFIFVYFTLRVAQSV